MKPELNLTDSERRKLASIVEPPSRFAPALLIGLGLFLFIGAGATLIAGYPLVATISTLGGLGCGALAYLKDV